MKISQVPVNEAFVRQNGFLAPNAVKWLRTVADSPMREVIDATNPPGAPMMKSGEAIVLKATAIAKTYLVYYDGTSRYYWETAGVDLY